MHAGPFLSSYPKHLSVRQGGSLLSYLRGLSVLLTEYFLCISPFVSLFFIGYCYGDWISCYIITFLNQVVKLYERCLIACANYPEYWIRYVLSMETSGSLDLANNALDRATQVFVKVLPHLIFQSIKCLVNVVNEIA